MHRFGRYLRRRLRLHVLLTSRHEGVGRRSIGGHVCERVRAGCWRWWNRGERILSRRGPRCGRSEVMLGRCRCRRGRGEGILSRCRRRWSRGERILSRRGRRCGRSERIRARCAWARAMSKGVGRCCRVSILRRNGMGARCRGWHVCLVLRCWAGPHGQDLVTVQRNVNHPVLGSWRIVIIRNPTVLRNGVAVDFFPDPLVALCRGQALDISCHWTHVVDLPPIFLQTAHIWKLIGQHGDLWPVERVIGPRISLVVRCAVF